MLALGMINGMAHSRMRNAFPEFETRRPKQNISDMKVNICPKLRTLSTSFGYCRTDAHWCGWQPVNLYLISRWVPKAQNVMAKQKIVSESASMRVMLVRSQGIGIIHIPTTCAPSRTGRGADLYILGGSTSLPPPLPATSRSLCPVFRL